MQQYWRLPGFSPMLYIVSSLIHTDNEMRDETLPRTLMGRSRKKILPADVERVLFGEALRAVCGDAGESYLVDPVNEDVCGKF